MMSVRSFYNNNIYYFSSERSLIHIRFCSAKIVSPLLISEFIFHQLSEQGFKIMDVPVLKAMPCKGYKGN